MAKIEFKEFGAYQDIMHELELSTDGVIKPAVYEGAAIIVDAVKDRLHKVVSDKSSGDLESSMGLAKMRDDQGFIHTKLGFEGYDRKGHPNVVKARALESGTSKQKKTPFIRPAVNAAKGEAVEKMRQVVDQKIKETTSGRR